MYYLSAGNRGLFKSYYCYVLFLPFEKSFKYYEKCIYFYLCIFFKKNYFFNKYKKQMCYKENKSLVFLTSLKIAKFFLQRFVIFNMATDSFLVE